MVRIANAPCSWGVIEGIDGETAGYARVVDDMAETGCAGTELGDWGFMPTDPDELRAELDARGLALMGSWVSVWLHDRSKHEASADDVAASREHDWTGPESVGHGVFCELGEGGVDFPGMVEALKAIDYKGWVVVEQDVLPGRGNPRENARRNREYLRSIGV